VGIQGISQHVELKAATGQVEVTPLRDSGKGKYVEKTVQMEVELEKD
jgi:hypothetical protein